MSADDEPPSPIEISIQNPEGFPEIGESRLRPWLADLLPEVAPQRTSFAVSTAPSAIAMPSPTSCRSPAPGTKRGTRWETW